MKRFLSVLLVLTLVFLCGCSAKEDNPASTVNDKPSTVEKPVAFAETTVLEDEIVTFRVLSESYEESGAVTYDVEFKNNAASPLTVTLENVTLNKQATKATVSVELAKDETKTATLSFTAEETGSEKVTEVGVHLKATGKKDADRWYVDTLSEHDLVFYPIAP